MAATDLARGRSVKSNIVQNEVTMFLLMKEFGGLPNQWKKQSVRDIKCITTMLSTYNSVSNAEMNRASKGKGGTGAGYSAGSSTGKSSIMGKKYKRVERVGPNGIETVDIPI